MKTQLKPQTLPQRRRGTGELPRIDRPHLQSAALDPKAMLQSAQETFSSFLVDELLGQAIADASAHVSHELQILKAFFSVRYISTLGTLIRLELTEAALLTDDPARIRECVSLIRELYDRLSERREIIMSRLFDAFGGMNLCNLPALRTATHMIIEVLADIKLGTTKGRDAQAFISRLVTHCIPA